MTPHTFPIRVYYEDTDFSGNVYHATYLHFFERARTELLRERGIRHSELARDGIAFAVRSMQIEFEAAAHIDDMLEVATEVRDVSGARLHLSQQIALGQSILVRAEVVVVAIKPSGKPTRLPKPLLAALTSRESDC